MADLGWSRLDGDGRYASSRGVGEGGAGSEFEEAVFGRVDGREAVGMGGVLERVERYEKLAAMGRLDSDGWDDSAALLRSLLSPEGGP